jgi:hypothetical protein
MLDPTSVPDGQLSQAISWPGHPLEPLNCLDEETAEQLSDWDWAGRAELHNEYLEYGLVTRPDNTGRMRPKRFIATTELMEWWQTMAVHEPEYFLDRVNQIAGIGPSMSDLFGVTSQDWLRLPQLTRERRFRTVMAGNGRNQPPASGLNPQHLLFMAHPINGLDDLIFVVHFGSFPYSVSDAGGRRRATIEEIFLAAQRPELFLPKCRSWGCRGGLQPGFRQGNRSQSASPQIGFCRPAGNVYPNLLT